MLTGGQSVGAAAPAARPEAAPYLLQEDVQHNQTQSDKQAGSQPVEQTATGMDVRNVSEAASRSASERASQAGSDFPTVTLSRLQPDTRSETNATKLVRPLQVSAVHRGNTER